MSRRDEARWNSSSRDGQMLQSLIMSGAIDDKMTPSQVQAMYPQFMVYPNNTFSGNLRRFRQQYGPGGRAGMPPVPPPPAAPAGVNFGPPQPAATTPPQAHQG